MSAFTISAATEDEVREIQLGRRLRHFNYTIVGEYPEGEAIWLNAKDEAGNLLGGFRGEVFFGWLLINVLFVEKSERGRGLGRRLLAHGEDAAREKGALHARLDTFEWQAPGFYLKQGYEEYCRMPNYFKSFALFLLRKDL